MIKVIEGADSMSKEQYIEFRHISKEFPGVKALNDINFTIKKGETHAILGENGAGKSTLLNILHGIYQPTDGELLIDGEKMSFDTANDAIRYGIAKVHQEINMVPEMTVAQNIALGNEPKKFGIIDFKKLNKDVEKVLQRLHCTIKPTDKTGDLTNGEMQILQIAKALYLNSKVLSLDEPTASLSTQETEILFEIIEELKEKGITILYISHRLDEIFRIADRATVMRDGKYIGTFEMKDMTKEKLIYNMVGRDVEMFATRQKPSRVDRGVEVMRVDNLSDDGMVKNVDFNLYKGEILGFFGLVGAGRTDVMRTVFGASKKKTGSISIHGKEVNIKNPTDAVKSGIALIPEDRKRQGFNYNLSNGENMALASLGNFTKYGLINHRKKLDQATKLLGSINLKPNDPNFMTANLSGGNQQKVVLGKWLSASGDIMIFDEPTKGIDVGAKAEIYALMEELLEQGKSIIMVSSELTEVMGMSDRIYVMKDGKITAEIDRNEFNEQMILTCALEENEV